MNKINVGIILLFFNVACLHATAIKNYITISGDKLYDGKEEFRFISFNVPNLHYIEDNMPFTESNPWRLPDDFEILDAFKTIRQMGCRVVRIYPITVRNANEGDSRPVHVSGPGQFNDEAFKTLDKVLFYANEMGIRVIIPLVDYRENHGSHSSYAAFRNKPADDFWTDPDIINDFKLTIKYIINRKNLYTGEYYRNDKAILGWETVNKLAAPALWTSEIAGFIKLLDKNHLVIDGFNSSIVRDESLLDPNIDIVTTHFTQMAIPVMCEQIQQNRARSVGRKVYMVGESEIADTKSIGQVLDVIIDNGINGAIIGDLYTHNRDGGFYWHSGNPLNYHQSYHWPGFSSDSLFTEKKFLTEISSKALQIQNKNGSLTRVPEPPTLLPINDVAEISWQGSTGAVTYDIERASGLLGKWITIAKDVDDAWVQNAPLFADKTAKPGVTYYYRVIAKNEAGASQPSNQVKAKRIKYYTLVDEMQDERYIYSEKGLVSFTNSNARECKEDLHRLAGSKDACITYHLPQQIISFRLYTFYPDSITDMKLYVSDTGEEFIPITPQRTIYKILQHDCLYYTPVLYETSRLPNYIKFLKINFTTNTELSRMEIKYGN